MNDDEQLNLLSIFHYIVGGLTALMSLFPVFHLVLGIAMVSGGFGDNEPPEARLMGWFFIGIAVFMIACGMTLAACMIVAGRFLARRVSYKFCLVTAAVECIFIPFGTVLGVFTIIVLQRQTVKPMFATTKT